MTVILTKITQVVAVVTTVVSLVLMITLVLVVDQDTLEETLLIKFFLVLLQLVLKVLLIHTTHHKQVTNTMSLV